MPQDAFQHNPRNRTQILIPLLLTAVLALPVAAGATESSTDLTVAQTQASESGEGAEGEKGQSGEKKEGESEEEPDC